MAEGRPLADSALVFAGGAVGTLLRAVVSDAAGSLAGTFAVDVAGSFLLGLLLGLAPSPRLRLLLGVGGLGGLTTYSTFALGTLGLGQALGPLPGALAGIGHAASGVLAAGLGLALAGRLRRARAAGPREQP